MASVWFCIEFRCIVIFHFRIKKYFTNEVPVKMYSCNFEDHCSETKNSQYLQDTVF